LWLTCGMDNSRFLECLAADYSRIRAIVPGHVDSPVPTCPEWTVADLTRHVGQVYLHKVEAMRTGVDEPEEWPPTGLQDEDPVELLDRSYAELMEEFANRKPSDVAATWYGPDQTVGFWVRRMSQETVVHRIDAELGVGVPMAPIPDDLAIDGVDELLKVFVAFSVGEWRDYFTEALADSPGRSYALATDGALWRVRTSPGHFDVTSGPGLTASDDGAPDVTIGGTPTALLRWGWNRETPGEPSGVIIEGDQEALAEFRRCVVISTQ
jgi:uncharacterized protein (TIGR03083 family)